MPNTSGEQIEQLKREIADLKIELREKFDSLARKIDTNKKDIAVLKEGGEI